MDRKTVHTDRAPAAIGPYSQGVVCGGLLLSAGQIPLHPETGQLVEGDIADQVGRAVENLRAVLEEGGAGLQTVLRLDIYLTDLSDFPSVNERLSKIFGDDPPARVTVEVSGLPMGARVEIAAIAAVR